jgi:cobyrinic acid a,c-diamide synthase
MAMVKPPRLMLAGTGGDCGKTFVALGLTAAWRRKGMSVAPFKKGPDYIDAAWLTLAAGIAARNLDTWMMNSQVVLRSFLGNSSSDGINLIEGNRGLHDGEDAAGTCSSAELSKLLKTPVVLVLPVVKITRTAAALALGLRMLDPEVEFAGVILNRVATARQESVIRTSVEKYAGLPVLGAVPRLPEGLLSSRHLGLVTPEEHSRSREVIDSAADIISRSVDLHRLQTIAGNAVQLESEYQDSHVNGESVGTGRLKIGFFQSPAFTFYYPENLEAIDRAGAVRVAVDPLRNETLPDLDALYIGGGFPETHASMLSANTGFLAAVAEAAQKGLPIWAECGGLIFLSRSVHWEGKRYPMAGVFPADIVLDRRPAGHGYEEVAVDQPNPFFRTGSVLRGHEFHYSRLDSLAPLNTILRVNRGTGTGGGRDGLIFNRTVASYLHLHALATPEWAPSLLAAAADYSRERRSA